MTIPVATVREIVETLRAIADQEAADPKGAADYARALGHCRGRADGALMWLREFAPEALELIDLTTKET